MNQMSSSYWHFALTTRIQQRSIDKLRACNELLLLFFFCCAIDTIHYTLGFIFVINNTIIELEQFAKD